jgi:hypothetical protein
MCTFVAIPAAPGFSIDRLSWHLWISILKTLAFLIRLFFTPSYVFCRLWHNLLSSVQCAAASRWVSQDVATSPNGTRRDPFAEYHASKTRGYIDRTMATGMDIFSVLQACILLSWYFYAEGRWVEVLSPTYPPRTELCTHCDLGRFGCLQASRLVFLYHCALTFPGHSPFQIAIRRALTYPRRDQLASWNLGVVPGGWQSCSIVW